jgi:puromycin-sensitive aminopeptidase
MPSEAVSSTEPYRLPRNVTPDHYELTISVDLDNGSFTGSERIDATVNEASAQITLNAAELDVQSASVTDSSGKSHSANVATDAENQRITLSTDVAIPTGKAQLQIRFSGVLSDRLHGFYRSTYRDTNGDEQVIATTQFEPTDARHAFPCWDEPDLKATYRLALEIPADLTAISNTAVESRTELGGGRALVQFGQTMKMSTYLVAYVVGKLVATEPVMVGNVPLRVVCVPGKEHLSKFALDVGAFSLDFFANYYGIPYPGDKVDLIAIPDFASGAMENLGAITFRETALLADPAVSARGDLERVADVVAHELAHMWFGDLVTMRWWNGIWLNEAFATFMEMLAVDAFKPAWKRWTTFGLSRSAAMATDSLASTRPIEYPVRLPSEAEGMFDILTYEKGGAVLRMLEQYIDPKVFQKGVSQYLDEHAYDNTETTDLWDSIEAASGQPVRKMMDSWIFQGGYPLVTVEREGNELKASQRRFRYLPETNGEAHWDVPIMIRSGATPGSPTLRALMSESSVSVSLSDPNAPLVVNAGGHGFYRVRYSRELLDRLTANLQSLEAIERFNLVSDTWASTVAGLAPVSDALALISQLGGEHDRNVWRSVLDILGYISRSLEDSQLPGLQRQVRQLVQPALDAIGWDQRPDESEDDSQLRATLVRGLAVLGNDPRAQEESNRRFKRYLDDPSSVDPNLAPALIGVAAFTGDGDEYARFLERYTKARTPHEEQRFLFARAEFQQPELLQRTLDDCLTEAVRTQDAPYLISAVMMNRDGSELTWSFVKRHWDEINQRYPANTIPRMSAAITALVRRDLYDDAHRFFQEHPVPQAGKMIDQYLERLLVAVTFREREASALASAFA